ncbi:methyltransferase domain-containing protein [Chitinibacter bivalviorum]|uniref:Methyltransferase domain-containing protein n=1 Tax=Chitinibacter bivalviorum TaxID=2739434 RepID=A0A7H9BHF9_9NEIS|nr:class I SAM-dependent methyltransferase [Chitinibacter bivalviorum]QLG87391.1 methyltransferase domain-containing protein [Chitinibacter bivalviorum]
MSQCRSCGATLEHTFADLGLSPVSNAFIREADLQRGEMYYPLHVQVCGQCWLVQLNDVLDVSTHFHDDYVYFSSYSSSWLAHARQYVENMTQRFKLGDLSQVVEIASNDGYLLQYFQQAGIPCLGIEPSANTARIALERGIDTLQAFFNIETATKLIAKGVKADLLLGNNVLAHVPDLQGFVIALKMLLGAEGVITLEFPHLQQLIANNQFDTIYHEHYSYLSLTALIPVFNRAGLRIFDVQQLPTHGGSLRIFACHQAAIHPFNTAVDEILRAEDLAGLQDLQTYSDFSAQMQKIKYQLITFLIAARQGGKRVAAYGAAAKGNTLLNYCGIKPDLLTFVADRNHLKQGRYLPGSRIPVYAPDAIFEHRPDYLLILPWNIQDEIMAEMSTIREWGGQFVCAIPEVKILS